MDNQVDFEVYSPLGTSAAQEVAPLDGIVDLNGRTVGYIWDWVFRGDEMFEIISEHLAAQFPDVRFVDHTVFGNMHGPEEREIVAALPGKLHEHGVDAVVVGVGA
jgi:hypothetical protein